MTDLEKRFDAVCESLEEKRQEFEEACQLLVDAIGALNNRVERIEKWMLEKNKLKLVKEKTRTIAAKIR